MIVFLIGARASGKTSIGERLARELDLEFVDTDVVLGELSGTSIASIVEQEGWAGFRARESEALRHASAQPGRLIATGGGIVLDANNRAHMRESGRVLYLSAPADVLAGRLAADPDHASRPSLTGKTITDEVADILAQRDALYRETAHHILDAALPPGGVVAQALHILRNGKTKG